MKFTLFLATLLALSSAQANAKGTHVLIGCGTDPYNSKPRYTVTIEWDLSESTSKNENLTMVIQRDGMELAKLGEGEITYSNYYGEDRRIVGREIAFSGSSGSLFFRGSIKLLDNGDNNYSSPNNVNGLLILHTSEQENLLEPGKAQFAVTCAAVETTRPRPE